MNCMTHQFKLDDDEAAYLDRRSSPRRKTRFKAVIVHGEDRQTVDCVVRDLSDGGARLRLDAPGALPAQFHLFWLADRAVLSVEAVWRSSNEMGVKFHAKHDMQGKLSSELAAICRAFDQRGRAKGA
jgi:hypothetical protein